MFTAPNAVAVVLHFKISIRHKPLFMRRKTNYLDPQQ
jgi:hypothetical protein